MSSKLFEKASVAMANPLSGGVLLAVIFRYNKHGFALFKDLYEDFSRIKDSSSKDLRSKSKLIYYLDMFKEGLTLPIGDNNSHIEQMLTSKDHGRYELDENKLIDFFISLLQFSDSVYSDKEVKDLLETQECRSFLLDFLHKLAEKHLPEIDSFYFTLDDFVNYFKSELYVLERKNQSVPVVISNLTELLEKNDADESVFLTN